MLMNMIGLTAIALLSRASRSCLAILKSSAGLNELFYGDTGNIHFSILWVVVGQFWFPWKQVDYYSAQHVRTGWCCCG